MKETVNWSFEDQEFTATLEVKAKPATDDVAPFSRRLRQLVDEAERMEDERSDFTGDVQRLRERCQEYRRSAARDGAIIGILAGLVMVATAVAVWGWLV